MHTHQKTSNTFVQSKFASDIPKWGGFFTPEIFLLGVTEDNMARLINHLFMIIKRYIYVTRCTEGTSNEKALLDFIHYHFDLEHSMLIYKNGRIDIFDNKWKPLYPTLFPLEN